MQSNAELVKAVLRGERSAFEELVRRYERAAWTTAWRVVRDYHVAQDVTQEAFVEAYGQLHQLQHPEHFGVWLLRIAHRRAIRASKRRDAAGSLSSCPLESADTLPEQSTTEREELFDAVAKLPDHERLVVVLRYFGGHSITDVAELTGRPVGTVTKQLSRAVERLTSTLREIET